MSDNLSVVEVSVCYTETGQVQFECTLIYTHLEEYFCEIFLVPLLYQEHLVLCCFISP